MTEIRWRAVLLAPLAATIVLAATSCGTQKYQTIAARGTPTSPTVTKTSGEIALTPQWAAEGKRLRQFKASAEKHSPHTMSNAGNWAYESLPTDITGNGIYKLNFGPVGSSFNYPKQPSGVAFNFPTDMHFSVAPLGAQVTRVDGHRYLQVTVRVTGFRSPYTSLTAWAY